MQWAMTPENSVAKPSVAISTSTTTDAYTRRWGINHLLTLSANGPNQWACTLSKQLPPASVLRSNLSWLHCSTHQLARCGSA